MAETLLKICNLTTWFFTEQGVVRAVDGVSLDLREGESLGIVGESGSGKTVTALSVTRLVPMPPGRIVHGEVWFNSHNMLQLSEREMRKVRGRRISMIFQEPMTALNPAFRVGFQIAEGIRRHQKVTKTEARKKVLEVLELARIPDPSRVIDQYPHELSGGMQQRVMIAGALCCQPKLLIADEPTTALDVTTQAAILNLLKDLQRTLGMSIMFITHNLGVVAQMCDRVVVMYAGKVMEFADLKTIFGEPLHPYTQGLMKSTIRADRDQKVLETMAGFIPNMLRPPSGCRFHPRCPLAVELCAEKEPELLQVKPGHSAACLLL